MLQVAASKEGVMTARQRYLDTILFRRPRRLPLLPGGPRESTLAAWHGQGLPHDVDLWGHLAELVGVPVEAFHGPVAAPMDARMIPQFKERVLAHRHGHYFVQDWMGATTEISDRFDYTYIRTAKDFVTRKWHAFPVTDRASWVERMAWRYDPDNPARLPDDAAVWAALEGSDRPVTVHLNGPFWQMREWVGFEGLCLMMKDDPALVDDMAEAWRAFGLALLERVLRRVRVDIVHLSEDMAYKAHSMISPALARRFLSPCYHAWGELLRSYGVPVYAMDSDGHIDDLIPLWLEAGINQADPMEVAAGNDLAALRARWGRQLAYVGGIDKRAIAAGEDALVDEFARVRPVLRDGGYLPSCDHGVPPDISWPNFVAYTRLLARETGWG